MERPPSPLLNKRHIPLAVKHCLDNGRDSMFILLDKSFKNKNLHAMDMPKATTLEIKRGPLNEHVATSHVLSSILGSLEFVSLQTTYFYEGYNHLLNLVVILFERTDVNAYVYHKHYKSHSSMVAGTLQLEQLCPMFGGEDGDYTTMDSCKMKFPWSSLGP